VILIIVLDACISKARDQSRLYNIDERRIDGREMLRT
jgi:hypothetical protein